jgi:hypothetical protein
MLRNAGIDIFKQKAASRLSIFLIWVAINSTPLTSGLFDSLVWWKRRTRRAYDDEDDRLTDRSPSRWSSRLQRVDRMKGKNRKEPRANLDMSSKDALARFAPMDRKEVAEELTADLLQKREAAEKRIATVRKELEDGARPRRGRFRL